MQRSLCESSLSNFQANAKAGGSFALNRLQMGLFTLHPWPSVATRYLFGKQAVYYFYGNYLKRHIFGNR